VSEPARRRIALPAGEFRVLEWPGAEPPAIFLHGLTGVAEVWGPTVAALAPARHSFALDQRGHGHSAKPVTGYAVAAFLGDLLEAMRVLGLDRPHLVGHSMGARVALVAAARHPERFRSVAIVDIGPDQWRANWQSTVAAFDRMPPSYPSAEAAVGGARNRGGESADAALADRQDDATLRTIALARLRTLPDGSVTWLANREALKRTVIAHRSRNYWHDWERISIPALLVRGGTSGELRPAVSDRMRSRNPRVGFRQFEGVGHNIPLLAPGRLAATLSEFWPSVERSGAQGMGG
jgi:pimeloyl-ACP methyl ester carboxylesterase